MTIGMAYQIRDTPRRDLPVTYGWHLAGPGPARFGWAWHAPTGALEYIGRSWWEAQARARRHIDSLVRADALWHAAQKAAPPAR